VSKRCSFYEFGEFGERESGVDAGPAAVTDERDQLVVGGTECSPWPTSAPVKPSTSTVAAPVGGGRR
jgi:hypothetical protein